MRRNVMSMMLGLFIAALLGLAGCGGGGGGGGGAPVDTVSGIVSINDNVLSGTVYLTDSAIPPKEGFIAIAADGSYSIDVTGMTKPYQLKAYGTANGQFYTLYAVAADKGITNINQSTILGGSNDPPPTTPTTPTGSGAVTHPYLITTPGSVMKYSDGSTETVLSNGNGVLKIAIIWNDPDAEPMNDITTFIASGANNIAASSFTYHENGVPYSATLTPALRMFPSSFAKDFIESQTYILSSEGHSSESVITTMTVMGNNETVTVPAGTFTNVLKIHHTEDFVDEYIWIAPGVGNIKSLDLSNNEVIELVSYIKK